LHAVELGRDPAEKRARLWESYFAFLDDEPEFTRLLQWENLEKGRHLTKANHLLIHFIGLCFIDHSNRFSLSQSLNLDLGNVDVKR
jgi:hypothetical protein